MIRIYNDNRHNLGSIDGFFNYVVRLKNVNEECKEYMMSIDKAKVVDVNTEMIKTPYGVCSMDRLSTGAKAILSLYNIIDRNKATPMNIDECDKDIVSILFDIAEKYDNSIVSFALHWGNVREDDKHTFLLNDTIVCNGGAELLKHFNNECKCSRINEGMEKMLFNRINISNCQKSAVFDIELKGKYTMIGGKSGTGKSILSRILQENAICSEAYESLGEKVAYRGEDIRFLNHGEQLLIDMLNWNSGKLIVIDNFDYLVYKYDELAELLVKDTTNQYILLGRNYKVLGLDKRYTGELIKENGVIKLAYKL